MKYTRTILPSFLSSIGTKPVIIIYGSRQTGKTTFVKTYMEQSSRTLYMECDNPQNKARLENRGTSELRSLVSGYDTVILDEAQQVRNIGTTLKLIADHVPGVQVIATSSSSFELANKLNEPLTGRNKKFTLFPLSLSEIITAHGNIEVENRLHEYLSFGMYPEVVSADSLEKKRTILRDLTRDYLFKDVFQLGTVRYPFEFEKLIQLIALRVGSEIAYDSLAKEIGISRDRVHQYVTLLEQAFIVFRLTPLYTNKTKEINKNHKIYFYDVGIRNALIGNTDPIDLRTDKSTLFENFFIAEKVKEHTYAERDTQLHFWRSRQGSEIDLVEATVSRDKIQAFDCKWKTAESVPVSFATQYPHAKYTCITAETIVSRFAEQHT